MQRYSSISSECSKNVIETGYKQLVAGGKTVQRKIKMVYKNYKKGTPWENVLQLVCVYVCACVCTHMKECILQFSDSASE